MVECLENAGKIALKVKSTPQFPAHKKWFDFQCRLSKHNLCRLANRLGNNHCNSGLRKEYYTQRNRHSNIINKKNLKHSCTISTKQSRMVMSLIGRNLNALNRKMTAVLYSTNLTLQVFMISFPNYTANHLSLPTSYNIIRLSITHHQILIFLRNPSRKLNSLNQSKNLRKAKVVPQTLFQMKCCSV